MPMPRIRTTPDGRDYIDAAEIPSRLRPAFDRWIRSQACPVMEGVALAIYPGDWNRFLAALHQQHAARASTRTVETIDALPDDIRREMLEAIDREVGNGRGNRR